MTVAARTSSLDPSRTRCDRWRRPGHDRLYVNDSSAEGIRRVGYRDLLTGTDHPTSPEDLATLTAVADDWEIRRAVPAPAALRRAQSA